MKFTESKDGVERTTVLLQVRFSREEIETLKAMAKKRTQDTQIGSIWNWRDIATASAMLGIDMEGFETDANYAF